MSDQADIGAEIAEREAYAWEQFEIERNRRYRVAQERINATTSRDAWFEVRLAESLEFVEWYNANVPAGVRMARPDTGRADLHLVPADYESYRPFWGE